MLIVSKEHDYYDTAHDGFIDKTIVYQRTPVQTKDFLKERFDYFRTGTKGKKVDIEFPHVGGHLRATNYSEHKDLFIVGFCGKFYIGLHHTVDTIPDSKNIDRYIYDFDEIVSCLELKPEKKPTKYTSKWSWNWGYTGFFDFYRKYNGVEYQCSWSTKYPSFTLGLTDEL